MSVDNGHTAEVPTVCGSTTTPVTAKPISEPSLRLVAPLSTSLPPVQSPIGFISLGREEFKLTRVDIALQIINLPVFLSTMNLPSYGYFYKRLSRIMRANSPVIGRPLNIPLSPHLTYLWLFARRLEEHRLIFSIFAFFTIGFISMSKSDI